MVIHVNEQTQRALQAKAAEGHFASVEAYVEAVLVREAGQGQADAANALEHFHQGLRQSGLLLSSPKLPPPDAGEPFEPITISGEPLSTTVITERR